MALVKAVNRVIDAPATEFPDVAVEMLGDMMKIKGIGIGVATRLLALARPCKIVSVNDRSRTQLKNVFPDAGSLGTPKSYGRLLRRLYQKPWYDVDKPGDEFE